MSFFWTSVFYGKIGQENVFDHILERKNAFLASKNQKIKKSKKNIFPNGLTLGFGSKMDNFLSSVF